MKRTLHAARQTRIGRAVRGSSVYSWTKVLEQFELWDGRNRPGRSEYVDHHNLWFFQRR